MEIPLKLSTRQIDLPPGLEQEIRDRAQKLERLLHSRLTSCRIAVEGPGNRHQTGGPYRVRLDITVPGSELVAAKEAETLNVAVQAAFQAAERQVEEYARLRRGEVKSPSDDGPAEGRVVRIFPAEGFGLLTGRDGREVSSTATPCCTRTWRAWRWARGCATPWSRATRVRRPARSRRPDHSGRTGGKNGAGGGSRHPLPAWGRDSVPDESADSATPARAAVRIR